MWLILGTASSYGSCSLSCLPQNSLALSHCLATTTLAGRSATNPMPPTHYTCSRPTMRTPRARYLSQTTPARGHASFGGAPSHEKTMYYHKLPCKGNTLKLLFTRGWIVHNHLDRAFVVRALSLSHQNKRGLPWCADSSPDPNWTGPHPPGARSLPGTGSACTSCTQTSGFPGLFTSVEERRRGRENGGEGAGLRVSAR